MAESGGTSGDIGVWRNACPVDCGWHGSDWEGRGVAADHRTEEAEAHECLRADAPQGAGRAVTAIPPLETEAQALALPGVAAAARAAAGSGDPAAMEEQCRVLLSDACARCGVTLGGLDSRILVVWMAGWGAVTAAVVTRALECAFAAGKAAAAEEDDTGG